MRKTPYLAAIARPAHPASAWLRALLIGGALAAASSLQPADAASVLDGRGKNEAEVQANARYTAALQRTAAQNPMQRMELSDQDYSAFSGVGVMACTVGGATRSSTAFLVGGFDIAVTVAHTFERAPGDAEPECLYNSVDSLGQVRERIPVSYVKTQWSEEGAAANDAQTDLAVVRLSKPSRYAQRTMPLGRFTGSPTPAVLVGYNADIDVDTVKRKARGTVYGPRSVGGFLHDIDTRGMAAGAPVLDERSGVIIGIHSPMGARRNTMVSMTEWLENTLRDEMKLPEQAGANAN